MIGPARQLQEAGGIEKDREGVGLHAGEGQVPLFGETDEQRQRKRMASYQLLLGDKSEVL